MIPEKAKVLKARFYPIVEVDLSDILDTFFQENTFQNSLEIPIIVTADEVNSLLKVCKSYKALGNNCIPNGFLRAIGPKLVEAVARLANAY